MNRFLKVAAPPIAFALAALLAWGTLSNRQPEQTASPRAVAKKFTTEPAPKAIVSREEILQRLEREFLQDEQPAPKTWSGEEMERRIEGARSGFVGADSSMYEYAYFWAQQAPEEMLAWIKRRGPIGRDFLDPAGLMVSNVFQSLAGKDMEKALAEALLLTNQEWKQTALASTAEVLWKTDPAAARELLVRHMKLITRGDRNPFSWGDGENWKMLKSLPPSPDRMQILADLLSSGARHEGPQTLAAWEELPEDDRRELVAAGFSNRYAGDGDLKGGFAGMEDLLREHAEATGDARAAEKLFKEFGADWVARDFGGVLRWMEARFPEDRHASLAASLFEAAAGKNFDRAVSAWQTLPEGALKARAARALVAGADAGHKEEAKRIFESLPPEERAQSE